MVHDAQKMGSQITVNGDQRITKVGRLIRKLHLDETIQLVDVLIGNMSFVGSRPEVYKYVEKYTDEMFATLLIPAGITSLASIMYQNERELIDENDDVDKVYIEKILPAKMKYNLYAIEHFTLTLEIRTMLQTVYSIFHKNYKPMISQENNEDDVCELRTVT